MRASQTLAEFAKRFLTGRLNWSKQIARVGAITNLGNVVSLRLLREGRFQVELFIAPTAPSSFPEHSHPDVDVLEYHLTGNAMLWIEGEPICGEVTRVAWERGTTEAPLISVPANTVHNGANETPQAFLSFQHWHGDTEMTSIGLNWHGDAASAEQSAMLAEVQHG